MPSVASSQGGEGAIQLQGLDLGLWVVLRNIILVLHEGTNEGLLPLLPRAWKSLLRRNNYGTGGLQGSPACCGGISSVEYRCEGNLSFRALQSERRLLDALTRPMIGSGACGNSSKLLLSQWAETVDGGFSHGYSGGGVELA